MSSENSLFETILGGFILFIAIFLFGYSYIKTSNGIEGGYSVIARFSRIDGMGVGADVKISGIKVGRIESLALNPQNYMAEAKLKINKSIMIPKDSSAEIVGEGLLGAKYISISVGGSDTPLKEGEKITNTQGSISIESLISKYMFSSKDEKGKSK